MAAGNFFSGQFFGGGFFGTTEQPSGGFETARLGPRRRTPEDIRKAREEFGVLPAQIIENVALRQAQDLARDEQQRIDELKGELRLRGLEMESRHLQALSERRQALIDAEIGVRIRAKLRAEEEDLVLILMLLGGVV